MAAGMNDSSDDVTHDYEGTPIPQDDAAPAEHPQQIGRYRIKKVLGKGGSVNKRQVIGELCRLSAGRR